jgi:hypothetical protein
MPNGEGHFCKRGRQFENLKFCMGPKRSSIFQQNFKIRALSDKVIRINAIKILT